MRTIKHKTDKMLNIEQHKGECIEEILRHYYVDLELTHQQIIDELNISYLTLVTWLHLAGIRSRKLSVQ